MNKRDPRNGKLFSLIIVALMLLAGCKPGNIEESTELPTGTPSSSPTETHLPPPLITESATPIRVNITSGPFKMVIPLAEIVTGSVESLSSTSDGSIWLITHKEVVRILENDLDVYLDYYAGQFVGADSKGRVWIVSEDTSQISAWNGNTWKTYGADSGWIPLDTDLFWEVYPGLSEFQGNLWLATSQDTRSFDGEKWAVFTRQNMGMVPPLYEDLMPRFTVKVFENGIVWVGGCDWGGPGPSGGGGLRWLENGIWQGESSPGDTGCVNNFVEDSSGRVWVGIDSGLWRYDPASGEWQEFELPESPIQDMRFGFIDSLAVDAQDEVWPVMVLCGGASCFGNCVLYHLVNEQWQQVGQVGEYDYGYWGPVFDATGNPWIHWEGGIYRIVQGIPELESPLLGRVSTVDIYGRIWHIASYENRDMLWVMDENASGPERP